MTDTIDPLALARQRGRLKAESLDRRLRQDEERERLDRIALLAKEPQSHLPSGEPDPAYSLEVWRLRQDVERLAAFHSAVLGSRAWRAVQWLRRPLGREW